MCKGTIPISTIYKMEKMIASGREKEEKEQDCRGRILNTMTDMQGAIGNRLKK
jgi:hypothetical protein